MDLHGEIMNIQTGGKELVGYTSTRQAYLYGHRDARNAAAELAAHAEAELPAGAQSGPWQPIETAPKDGSLFLCWVAAERWSEQDGGGSGYAADTSQVDFCWWRNADGAPNGGYFENASGQVGDTQDVTRWMQLPAAPCVRSEGGE